jgi:hypothetical protein
VTHATAMLTALGDPTRQAILERLTRRPAALRAHLDGFRARSPAAFQDRTREEEPRERDRHPG